MYWMKVLKRFDQAKVGYAIAGGWAVALHGVARGTIDLDLIITLMKDHYLQAEAILKTEGFEPRLPVNATMVFDFRKEYIANKNLIAWSFYNPVNPIEVIDILIPYDLKKMKIKRVKIRGQSLCVLAKKDLIAMKKQSARPQDLEDVKALEAP
jgi:predicted nucleotidyltransferase